MTLVMASMSVVVPVGIGVVVGVVGVSNLLRWLLQRFEKPTLGALLGLLFGAAVGLWPFYEPVEPKPGDIVAGQVVSAETLGEIDVEDHPLVRFDPTAGQAAGALALVGMGIASTALVARVGGQREEQDAADRAA